jgi:hypothetical protein
MDGRQERGGGGHLGKRVGKDCYSCRALTWRGLIAGRPLNIDPV